MGSRMTIGFQADGTLGGHGGCNGYGGSWSQSEDGALSVDGIISTLIACEQVGVTEQEQRLFRALQGARRAIRTDQTLRIDTGTGEYLLFDLVVREQVRDESFTGLMWELELFEQTDGDNLTAIEPLPGTHLTIEFSVDGTVRGNTGCNGWGAQWSFSQGGAMSLVDIFSTEIACLEPEGAMDQERQFLDALARVERIDSAPGQLWLGAADGRFGLRFAIIPSAEIRSISGGTSFGHCLGYCWEEVHLVKEGSTLVKGGWDPVAFPQKSVTQDLNGAMWGQLIITPELAALFSLAEVIGCPDCADGGAEWIEVESANGRRRVTYEFGKPPREVAELARMLQSLRDDMRAGFGVATAILE